MIIMGSLFKAHTCMHTCTHIGEREKMKLIILKQKKKKTKLAVNVQYH